MCVCVCVCVYACWCEQDCVSFQMIQLEVLQYICVCVWDREKERERARECVSFEIFQHEVLQFVCVRETVCLCVYVYVCVCETEICEDSESPIWGDASVCVRERVSIHNSQRALLQCVCVCVCACARVRVYVRMCVTLLTHLSCKSGYIKSWLICIHKHPCSALPACKFVTSHLLQHLKLGR